MPASPTSLSRLAIAVLACVALFAAAGCQRKQATESETSNGATPATAVPAEAPPEAPAPVLDDVPAGVLLAYVWHCADGQTLVMRNLWREKAIAIDFHDGTRRLDQAASASGARYADSVVVFWSRGSTATLERQGAAAVQCDERRADSLREDARARRVVYRALGNEPGWVLEIGPGDRLSWTTNFGEDRHDFDQALLSTLADGTNVYAAQNAALTIRASIQAGRCIDDGEVEFDHVVILESGGQMYRGCGTRLNAR